MHFARKIYYCNKPLILTNDSRTYIKEHPVAAGYLPFTGAFPRNFRLAFEHLSRPRTLGVVIEDLSPAALQQELHRLYQPVDAAGGVVQNEAGQVLMIYRRGKWDLPKGKRDEGEDLAACAVREVSEETGLQRLSLGSAICDTYHIYSQNGEDLVKRTIWYNMTGSSQEPLRPQAEENIQEARWIVPGELGPIVFKTYDAIKEVLHQAGYRW